MVKYVLNNSSKIHSNGDGYITKNGHTMFNQDIVMELNQITRLKEENEMLRASLKIDDDAMLDFHINRTKN